MIKFIILIMTLCFCFGCEMASENNDTNQSEDNDGNTQISLNDGDVEIHNNTYIYNTNLFDNVSTNEVESYE